MSKSIFISEILTVLQTPKICHSCGSDKYLAESIVSENISCGKTLLCTKCETLTIVTNLNLRRVELVPKGDQIIMLKDHYSIRKIR